MRKLAGLLVISVLVFAGCDYGRKQVPSAVEKIPIPSSTEVTNKPISIPLSGVGTAYDYMTWCDNNGIDYRTGAKR